MQKVKRNSDQNAEAVAIKKPKLADKKSKKKPEDTEKSPKSKKPSTEKVKKFAKTEEKVKKLAKTEAKVKKTEGKEPTKKFVKPEANGKKFSKPDKPKFKKPQSGSPNKFKQPNAEEKPTDWNEFKKKKKEVQVKRKQAKSFYEVTTRANQISEQLRKKKLEGGNEERNKLVNELHELMGNQGNYVKFMVSHDMARIIQYMLKFGQAKIREEIANEIIPSTVEMLQSKYGKFCVKRMLKYGNATIRANCIKATYANAVKLASHGVSSPVFEYAYTNWASPADKVSLIQEFFGDVYKRSKDSNVKHLKDVYASCADMKAAALSATKANLGRILNKNLLDSGLVQSVLWQFLGECSEEDRAEMITQLCPHIVVICNSKDGAKAAMECLWRGTNKDKKIAMKALKEHVVELCKHEHGHNAIIALMDSIDDTVLLNKMILGEILSKAEDLAGDEWGRKVLLWLVVPGDSMHFHANFMSSLEVGRKSSTSKKDPDIRRKELLSYSSDTLLKAITEGPKNWLDQASKAIVTLSILKAGSGVELQNALGSISKVIIDDEWIIPHENTEFKCIEHPGIHMTLKKLAQNDKNLQEKEGSFTFGQALLEELNDKILKAWLQLNRGCFLLLTIYENNGKDVQQKLKKLLQSHMKVLKKQETAGAKILYSKIK